MSSELLLYEAESCPAGGRLMTASPFEQKVVLCDRFYDSTFAYQAAGRGLTDLVHRANRLGSCGFS